MFERSAPRVHDDPADGILGETQYGHFGTNVMDGLDYENTYWFNMGIVSKYYQATTSTLFHQESI